VLAVGLPIIVQNLNIKKTHQAKHRNSVLTLRRSQLIWKPGWCVLKIRPKKVKHSWLKWN